MYIKVFFCVIIVEFKHWFGFTTQYSKFNYEYFAKPCPMCGKSWSCVKLALVYLYDNDLESAQTSQKKRSDVYYSIKLDIENILIWYYMNETVLNVFRYFLKPPCKKLYSLTFNVRFRMIEKQFLFSCLFLYYIRCPIVFPSNFFRMKYEEHVLTAVTARYVITLWRSVKFISYLSYLRLKFDVDVKSHI